MNILCVLTFIGLVNQPVDVQQIKKDMDSIFNLELNLPEIEQRACEYGNDLKSEHLPMLETLALQELEMGMRNQNLNLIKVGLMLRAYACGMFHRNPSVLHQRVIQAIESTEKLYVDSTIPSAAESIDEIELDKHFTFARIITREYLTMAYQGKEYSKCLDAASSALSSHNVYIRSIAIKNIRKMICDEKYENFDFNQLKNQLLEMKTQEKDLGHYTSMDEIVYKNLKKSIVKGIDAVLNHLQ